MNLIQNSIGDFFWGLGSPLRSARLLVKSPTLWIWALIPPIIAGALYATGFAWLDQMLRQTLGLWLASFGLSQNPWIGELILWGVRITLVVVSAFTFSAVTAIIASPCNDFLAEAAEAFVEPKLTPVPRAGWSLQLRWLIKDLGKNIFAGLATTATFLTSFVPVLNLVSATIAVLLLTFNYLTYPQTRRGESLMDGLRLIAKNFAPCLGFGLVHVFLFSIPVISVLCLPLAVIGGVGLYARLSARKAQPLANA
jgi:CysZ protein